MTPTRQLLEDAASDGGLTALVMSCAFAVIAGQKTVTISAAGQRPAGFPRGELLSVGASGVHNYAVCPVKALAWIHEKTSARAIGERMRESSTPDQAAGS